MFYPAVRKTFLQRMFDRVCRLGYFYPMSDTREDQWFYSHEGERLGPVTLSDLRIRAKDGGLNPRLDMVWTKGMAEWKQAGEMEELFDRSAGINMRGASAAPALPQRPPTQTPIPSFDTERQALPSEWPGARRLVFIFTVLILPFMLDRGIKNVTERFQEQLGSDMSGWIVLGGTILTVLLIVHASLERLVNLGMSRWWFFGNFVPFLDLWIWFRCFACPSGYAYHKKLDVAGTLLAVLYFVTLVLFVVAVAAAIAIAFGSIGTPEMRQQIQDAVRTVTAVKP